MAHDIEIPMERPVRPDVAHLEPWRSRLDIGKAGPLKTSLHNAVVVVADHHELRGLLQYDELAGTARKTRTPPWGGCAGEWTDTDSAELAAWFGDPDRELWPIASGLAHEAVMVVASRSPHHPIRAYLDGLPPWDLTERVPYLFADFFGARYDEYTAAVATNWLVAAVARVMRPGCKVDAMPVLEGPQGAGKSESIRDLFGHDWAAEAHESPTSKDFFQALTGKWAIEISEMQSFSRAEEGKVKQAVSCPVDRYRPSYGRLARDFPRQCVFCGTTNETQYLRDPTGARRFLPVAVGSEINREALRQARDNLWAEALARFRRGDPWWIFPDQARDEQESRYQGDSWEAVIRIWLDGRAHPDDYGKMVPPINEASTTELMRYALAIEIGKHTRQDQIRVGKIMQRIGWQRQRIRRPEGREYVYTRPESAP